LSDPEDTGQIGILRDARPDWITEGTKTRLEYWEFFNDTHTSSLARKARIVDMEEGTLLVRSRMLFGEQNCLEYSLQGLENLAGELKASEVYHTPSDWKWPRMKHVPDSVFTLGQECLALYRASSSSQSLLECERKRIDLLFSMLTDAATEGSEDFSPPRLFELRVRVAEFRLLALVYGHCTQVCTHIQISTMARVASARLIIQAACLKWETGFHNSQQRSVYRAGVDLYICELSCIEEREETCRRLEILRKNLLRIVSEEEEKDSKDRCMY
jgi:hypothetical protein